MWNGSLRAGHVLQLVGQLATIPRSRYRAAVLGDDLLGWGRTETVLANIFDRITALYEGDDLKDDHLYPRPSGEEEPVQAATVAEFNVSAFERLLGQ